MVAVLPLLTACPTEELVCVEIDAGCTPLYEPTWNNVYTNTFAAKCGVGGSTCHAGANPRGGLALDEPMRAYQLLTQPTDDYVLPGDPSCSEVIMRVRARSSDLRMPRGSRLADSEICALERWIAAGAPGPVSASVRSP